MQVRNPNSASLETPCRPNEKILKENEEGFSSSQPFPDVPLFTEQIDIICDRF
jgi:hypothetical protein